MDGVIFDTKAIVKDFIMKRYPGLPEKVYSELGNENFHEEMEKHSHLRVRWSEEEEKKEYADYAELKSKSKSFEGIDELLRELHGSGMILTLNTSAYGTSTVPLLEQSGLIDLFDFVASAEVSKSKVEKFDLIKSKYNLKKEDILFITDTLGDVKEAELADIPTVAVAWGYHDESKFKIEAHENLLGIAHSPAELRTFIKDLNSSSK